jgi:hypothetical protein
MIDLPPQVTTLLVVSTGILLLLLVASFMSRPRVFTQYLFHMTGITLSSREVATVYKERGKSGVRDLFLELIIREDLKDGPRITPDSSPDHSFLLPPPGEDER